MAQLGGDEPRPSSVNMRAASDSLTGAAVQELPPLMLPPLLPTLPLLPALPLEQPHRHGVGCGHRLVVHYDHLDFLDDGHLVHQDADGQWCRHLLGEHERLDFRGRVSSRFAADMNQPSFPRPESAGFLQFPANKMAQVWFLFFVFL